MRKAIIRCLQILSVLREEFTKEVFEEFAQEDSDVRTQYHGSGLGMAIVKKYVDM
mgnify:CR=1 FL=1